MPKKNATIGIDIGGTKTLAVLLDDGFHPVADIKMKTRSDKDEKQFTARLLESLLDLTAKARAAKLKIIAVGAGCAGRIDRKKGVILVSPNIPFLKNYPIADKLAKATSAPAFIANDVHAGLVGEHAFGAAKGYENAIGLFIGTGIGGALVIHNRLYTGTFGVAGDIGSYITDPLGPLSGSERSGILDHAASRTAIAGEAAVLAAKNWAPALNKRVGANVKEITSSELLKSIRGGDKAVEDLVRSRARMLGIVMANLANFLSPDVIVLGGGLVEAMPKIIVREAEGAMRPYLSDVISRQIKVAATKLKGHAVAIGAAKMALDQAGE